MAEQHLISSNGWLSFNKATPKVYITAESDNPADFDEVIIEQWRDEGFQVQYLPFGDGGKAYTKTLHSLGHGLGVGESYAIVGIWLHLRL